MVNFFQPQENPLNCGAATATIILNASQHGKIASQKTGEISKPVELGGGKIAFKLYSQKDFFNEKVRQIKDKRIIELQKAKTFINNDPVYDPGVTLNEFSEMLKHGHNFNVLKVHTAKNTKKAKNKFRTILKNSLSENQKFVIINYNGKKIGRKTGGHFSPIAAYDEKSDSVLILDVALHKGKWFWISIEELYNSMNTLDNGNYRGYLVVRKK